MGPQSVSMCPGETVRTCGAYSPGCHWGSSPSPLTSDPLPPLPSLLLHTHLIRVRSTHACSLRCHLPVHACQAFTFPRPPSTSQLRLLSSWLPSGLFLHCCREMTCKLFRGCALYWKVSEERMADVQQGREINQLMLRCTKCETAFLTSSHNSFRVLLTKSLDFVFLWI